SNSSFCFEPHVAQSVLRSMLSQAGVTLYTRKVITNLNRTSTRIYGLYTTDNDFFIAGVTIDASEYGDLLPMAGVDYRAGNSATQTGIFSSACVQDITYTAVLKKYPGGVPSGLVISSPPPGYSSNVAKFRQYLSATGLSAIQM